MFPCAKYACDQKDNIYLTPVYPGYFFYSYKVRLINISDDIKSVETETSDEHYKIVRGVFPLFRRYDTYCYSERYNQLSYNPEDKQYSCYKKNTLLKMPSLKILKKIKD